MPRFAPLLIVAAAIVGCETVNPPIEGRAEPFVAPQVSIAQGDLRRETAIGAPALQRDDAGNLLYVTLPIRSATRQTLYVDYKVTFFDRTGGVLTETGWMTKTLEANTPSSIRVNSTTDRAADFHIALRWAR